MPLTDTAAAGVAIPDTRLAREATELIRDRTDDLIYHHSRRCTSGAHCRAETGA